MLLKLTILERFLHRLHILPVPILDGFGEIIFGRVLTIAVRRGLFETVASQPRSISDIARRTNLSLKGVELLVDAFVIGGYLNRVGEKYLISKEGGQWLLKSSPHYIGNLIEYFETLYTRWGYFEYALEHGHPQRPYFDGFTEQDWKIYVYGMADLSKLLLREVGPKLILPPGSTSLLDIGGSHGIYAMGCCRRYPNLHGTVMDFASVLRYSHEIVKAEDMSGRVRLLGGDFTVEELPGDQDCVLMFNIVHGFGEEENKKLIARVFAVLKPGGKLFILDQIKAQKKSKGITAFLPLMVGLNLLNEIGGNVYDVDEIRMWCRDFSLFRVHALRLPGVTLLEAVK